MNPPNLELTLHPRQGEAFLSPATEILYGGAAGGGKSHLMRVAAIVWASEIAGLQVFLFRRMLPDLEQNHMEGPRGFRNLLAPWVLEGLVTLVAGEIRFWNGSRIHLCHCKEERDRFKYQGHEIHVLLIDELTHFTEVIYRFLRSRLRAVGLTIPPRHRGRFPRILCGSNPGNVGHQWVKRMFVDHLRPLEPTPMPPEEGGLLRLFIPALLEDNPSLLRDDPGYRARLRGLGSEALVRAMEQGDWNVVEGAFFDVWDPRRHVIHPFAIPADWLRFRAFDWGSARPFSVGWWAVSDGSPLPDGRQYPAMALIRYREWYGARGPNQGLKMTAEEIADGILEREGGEDIRYGVADPAIFATDGGPSHAERMARRGVLFRRADNRRVPNHGAMGGWDQLRARLKGEEGRPLIYSFSTCQDSIRTIPALQHDPERPEDVDTNGEDHAADEWRYACMSRPWLPQGDESRANPSKGASLNDLWDQDKNRSNRERI
ncbi:MAG: terminase [Magnetococcales bacterium]|nr:terminase [Magnetococcales bacterium]